MHIVKILLKSQRKTWRKILDHIHLIHVLTVTEQVFLKHPP